ncbi:hypothetical protein LCGC14_1330320 [marine sediment metagenome]|uniref:Uncharacterized protein n=1 Tax=marine sediment metagenome TaxID=412755 RepID=A0A0F9MXP3_9ZZZZ
MADSTGMADLRAENVDRIVKGFALRKYVMKQFCMIQSSSAWSETYYKETGADLEPTAKTWNFKTKEIVEAEKVPHAEDFIRVDEEENEIPFEKDYVEYIDIKTITEFVVEVAYPVLMIVIGVEKEEAAPLATSESI